jgi:nucleoside-diphosphate-sugar epimerase
MRVLIIGGTGNISTAITRSLIERGDDVTLFTRGRSEVPVSGRVKVLLGDRTDHAAFEAQVAAAGRFDCVIDMIGYHPADAESVVRAFRGRIGHLVFCSTVDVFTKPALRYPVCEDSPRGASPTFPYAYDKAVCENLLVEAHVRGDFPVTILRPAATYNDASFPISLFGPGPVLLKRIRQSQPVIVLGDGSSFWVSCHRDDVARAFVAAAGTPEVFGKSYVVAGEEWMTWREYYATVGRVMNTPPVKAVGIPTALLGRALPRAAEWCVENFQYPNVFDSAAARSDLGFRYTIPWEEGVRRMVAWHDARGTIDASPSYPLYDRILDSWERLGSAMVQDLVGADAP